MGSCCRAVYYSDHGCYYCWVMDVSTMGPCRLFTCEPRLRIPSAVRNSIPSHASRQSGSIHRLSNARCVAGHGIPSTGRTIVYKGEKNLESILLIGVIELLRRLRFGHIVQVVVSTLLICALHSAVVPIWGLLSIPPFLIGTAAYVYWRRHSFWTAALITVALHFCINLSAFLAVVRRALLE